MTSSPASSARPATAYPPREELLNVLSHGVGALLSVVALVLLVWHATAHGTARHITAFAIYGVSMALLYSASTAYHWSRDPELRHRLRVLDHAAIYVLIAGTYTPFALVTLRGGLGWIVLGVSWGFALIGIVLKLFFTGRFDKLSTAMYLAMGWLIVFAIGPLARNLGADGTRWLWYGGIAYTVGALLYAWRSLRCNHAAFHGFVLVGSACHFVAVYRHVLPVS